MEIIIDEPLLDSLLDFISCRKTVPTEVEQYTINNQKKFFKNKILGKKINSDHIPIFKEHLKKIFFNLIIHPGETVGIIAGQCIGEKTTQSSLNNFHSAGLDTGSTSQIDNLQNIINASKVKKKGNKYFRSKIFLKSNPKSLADLKTQINCIFDLVIFKDLIVSFNYKNVEIPEQFKTYVNTYVKFSKQICVFNLSLEQIFKYKITKKKLYSIFTNKTFCVPFSSLNETDEQVSLFCEFNSENDIRTSFFNFFTDVKHKIVSGIEGVGNYVYLKSNSGEWYIECMCSSLTNFYPFNIIDFSRTTCDSIYDMHSIYGVLVAQQVIIEKCSEIMSGVNEAHFNILATKMTINGIIDPLTRYTMRNNKSPLARASFEESFETFLKVCKFKEEEKFTTVSSSIIFGKKPKVGTYNSDILYDTNFL